MVKAMTKDTFSQPTMLFDLQRLDLRQPLPRQISPTKSQGHQKQPLPQDLARSPKQYSLTCFLCAKEVARRHPATVPRVLNQQVLFQTQAKWDALSTQKGQPIHSNKLAVCTNKFNTLPPEKPQVILHQSYTFVGIRATFLLQNSPEQRETNALKSDPQEQDIQRSLTQVPIGAINGDGKRWPQSNQRNHEASEFGEGQLEKSQEALNPHVMRRLFSSPTHHRRDLDEVDGLDLNQRDEKLSQKVDSSFIPSYILGKRSLQGAKVGHCALSFPDLFGDKPGAG